MKLFIGKSKVAIALSLLLMVATVFAHSAQSDLQINLRNLFFDYYQKAKPRTGEESIVVIVDIDEQSLAKIGQWPWPRTKLATITNTLTKAGALAIGFDMVFSEPDRTDPKELAKILELKSESALHDIISKIPSNDQIFGDAIANSPTVLGFIGSRGTTGIDAHKIAGISWLGADLSHSLQSIEGTIASLQTLQEGAKGSANFNIAQDQVDDIIRSVPMFVRQNNNVYPSLSIETLRVALENITGEQQSFIIKTSLAGGELSGLFDHKGDEATAEIQASIVEAKIGDFVFPTTADGQLILYYNHHNPNIYISAADILLADKERIANMIEDKIVLIGSSAAGLRDIRQTTLGERIPGVEIHSQIIDQIMDGVFLNRPDWMNGLEIFLTIVAALILIGLMPYLGPVLSALLGLSISATTLMASWIAFSTYGLLLDPIFPMLATAIIYIAMTVFLFTFADREKRFVRDAFKHYLAPDLIDRLQKDPKSLKLGGEIKELSLMFMDIRGFTSISEKLSPTQLVEFLNTLLSPLSDIIQSREGTIDKYIGDSIMAFWNAPLEVKNHPQKACEAALDMVSKLESMNVENAFDLKGQLRDVQIGIGINTGEGCVGNLGSKTRFDYSVIGDMVNVASRIETTTKQVSFPILISSSTAKACPNFAFLWAGNLTLKGKSEKQDVYALIGNEEYAQSDTFKSLKTAHEQICKQIGLGNKKKITSAKRECLALAPERIHAFIKTL